jgi:hypothetical protein
VIRILFLATTIILISAVGSAQVEKSHGGWFKLAGRVSDKNGRAVQWGRVCLEETHGHILKMKSLGHDGRFVLLWLNSRLHYEIYAEQGDLVSETVLIDDPAEGGTEIVSVNLTLKNNQDGK